MVFQLHDLPQGEMLLDHPRARSHGGRGQGVAEGTLSRRVVRKACDDPGIGCGAAIGDQFDPGDLVVLVRRRVALETQQHHDLLGRQHLDGSFQLAQVRPPRTQEDPGDRTLRDPFQEPEVGDVSAVQFHDPKAEPFGESEAAVPENVEVEPDAEFGGVRGKAAPDLVCHLEGAEKVVVLVVRGSQLVRIHQLVLDGVRTSCGGGLQQQAGLLRFPLESLSQFGDYFNLHGEFLSLLFVWWLGVSLVRSTGSG